MWYSFNKENKIYSSESIVEKYGQNPVADDATGIDCACSKHLLMGAIPLYAKIW